MAEGKISHHWDMFAPLICYVANPNLKKRNRLKVEKIHPFFEKRKRAAKPFNRGNWLLLKERIKR
jgi:hypothetical protein